AATDEPSLGWRVFRKPGAPCVSLEPLNVALVHWQAEQAFQNRVPYLPRLVVLEGVTKDLGVGNGFDYVHAALLSLLRTAFSASARVSQASVAKWAGLVSR